MHGTPWLGPLVAAGACCVLWAAVPPATASPPDPAFSTVPGRLFLCPAGDSAFVVVPRSFTDYPMPNVTVVVDLCGCPGVHLSRQGAVGYSLDPAGCAATEGPHGDATYRFALAGGGLCPGGLFGVSVNVVRLAVDSTVVSPDQNGDQIVDAADLAIETAKVGTADLSGDLDGDGRVTSADVALLLRHLGHASPDRATPALPVTWGRLKQIYR